MSVEPQPAVIARQPLLLNPPAKFTRNALIAIAIFAALSLAAGWFSEGFLEADGCMHYLYARFAPQEVHYFVNVWGRPFVTALYTAPAAFGGLFATRATSTIVATACAIVAMQVARKQGFAHPELALIFTLAQPLLFLHSFSEMTELPFALLLVLAFWAYQHRKFGWMTLLIGLAPLSRPEGFGFLFLAAAALVLHRRAWWLLLLPIPMIAWNHAGWMVFGQSGPWWRWLTDNWPYSSQSVYPPGPLHHFLVRLPVITSPLMFPAVLAGAWIMLREARSENSNKVSATLLAFVTSHRARIHMLIVAVPIAVFIGHSLLFWLGRMASSGELRYMLVVSPFWALLAARGWEWGFEQVRYPRPVFFGGIASLLPLLFNLFYEIVPLKMLPDWQHTRQLAEWYRNSDIRARYPKMMAAHVGAYYFLDISPAGQFSTQWDQTNLNNPPSGTIMVWDPMYAIYNADANRTIHTEDIDAAGWRRLSDVEREIGLETAGWRIYVSPD